MLWVSVAVTGRAGGEGGNAPPTRQFAPPNVRVGGGGAKVETDDLFLVVTLFCDGNFFLYARLK